MFEFEIVWYTGVSFVAFFLCTFAAIIHAPFRRIAILMQTSKELNRENILTTPYSGIANCIRRIIHTEGYRGLWKSFFICFLNFYFADLILQLITFLKSKVSDFYLNFCLLEFVLQIIVGLLRDLVYQPFEYVEILVSSDIAYGSLSKPKYHGAFDFFKKYKETKKSYRKLYIGLSILIAGQLLHKFLVEVTIVIFSLMFGEESKTFLEDVIPAVYSALVSFPFEILRQRDIVSGGKYGSNIVKGFRTIIKEEGVLSLYGGVSCITIILVKFLRPTWKIIANTLFLVQKTPGSRSYHWHIG